MRFKSNERVASQYRFRKLAFAGLIVGSPTQISERVVNEIWVYSWLSMRVVSSGTLSSSILPEMALSGNQVISQKPEEMMSNNPKAFNDAAMWFHDEWYQRDWRRKRVADISMTVRGLLPMRGLRVLDAGAGDGYAARWLASCGELELVECDISFEMLRRRDPDAMTRNSLGSICADIEGLPFCGKSFDLVICNSVLGYAGHPQAALAEMRRIIKRSGFLVLVVAHLCHRVLAAMRDGDKDNLKELRSTSRRFQQHFSSFERAWTAAGLSADLRQAGWNVTRVFGIQRDGSFVNVAKEVDMLECEDGVSEIVEGLESSHCFLLVLAVSDEV